MAVRSNNIRYGRSTSSRKNRSSPASFTASVQSVGMPSAVSWCTIAPGPNSATAALTGSKVSPTNPSLYAVRRAQAIDCARLTAYKDGFVGETFDPVSAAVAEFGPGAIVHQETADGIPTLWTD